MHPIKTFCTLALGATLVFAQSGYKILVETTDCNGETGFVSADADAIYKVETADCEDPKHPGKKLKMILIENNDNGYDLFTLTDESAHKVMQEVKSYMKAKKKMLEQGHSLIIKR